ncbi:MAG: hypothetical protein LBR11_12990 [Deltaproteobacteria bacterium]|jgi:hypothetical protein|nr:hypothetical protein [Deltaproteobacteria bacterium]
MIISKPIMKRYIHLNKLTKAGTPFSPLPVSSSFLFVLPKPIVDQPLSHRLTADRGDFILRQ